jgi:CHASE3 domain sensor protein
VVVKRALSRQSETDALLQKLSSVVGEKLAEMDRTIALKNALQDVEALAW